MNLGKLPILAAILLLIMPMQSVSGKTKSENSFSCPDNIKQLTSLLLRDLPDYSNRVIQRTQRENRKAGIRNFIITAGQPEFEPLNLPRIQYNSDDNQDPEQIFFTALERQYENNKITNTQTYHWLFLTKTDLGWQTVVLFSRFGNSKSIKPPAPPKETTNGIIGQGVQLWLKDCNTNRIRP